MSTKLLGCIQSWLDKLFPCLEKDRMVHAVFNSKLFLSNDTMLVIKEHFREILFWNKKLNPDHWCMCLPYELQKGGYHKDLLSVDYIILMPVSTKFLLSNGIHKFFSGKWIVSNK